ncbi:ArnT family glycosyltransferase [Nakamurella sp. GG22]
MNDVSRASGSGIRAPELVPIIVLALAGFLISLHVAFLAGPLWDVDERSHAAYSVSLLLGDLPTIDTPVVDEPARFPQISASLAGQDEAHSDIWTANHPPLYYLVSLPFVALADVLGTPGAGLLAMRVINALGTAIGILLVGLIARELVPRRPAVWALSTVFALSCTTVTHLGGFVFNDGLGVAGSSLTVLLGIRILKNGVTAPRLAGAACAGIVAASVRAPGVLAVIFCAAAVLLTGLQDARPRHWYRAIAGSALVAGIPAISISWFYLRNIALYGDVGATAALLQKFDRSPRGNALDVLLDPSFYRTQFVGLWVRTTLAGTFPGSAISSAVIWVGLGAATGLIVLFLVWLASSRLRPPSARLAGVLSRPTTQAWILLTGFVIAIEISAGSFRAAGGSAHVRYVFPILPPIAVAVAVGLLGLLAWIPPRWASLRDGLGLAGFGLFFLTIALAAQSISSAQISSRGRPSTLGGMWPFAAGLLAALFAIVGLAIAVQQILEGTVGPIRASGTTAVSIEVDQPDDEVDSGRAQSTGVRTS